MLPVKAVLGYRQPKLGKIKRIKIRDAQLFGLLKLFTCTGYLLSKQVQI